MVFKRSRNKNTKDKRGVIRVRVTLCGNDEDHIGNISKGLSIESAKVSEVVKAIEQALFGKENHE